MYRDPPAGSQNELKRKENVYLPVQPCVLVVWVLGFFPVSNDCSLLLDSRGWQRYGNRAAGRAEGKSRLATGSFIQARMV